MAFLRLVRQLMVPPYFSPQKTDILFSHCPLRSNELCRLVVATPTLFVNSATWMVSTRGSPPPHPPPLMTLLKWGVNSCLRTDTGMTQCQVVNYFFCSYLKTSKVPCLWRFCLQLYITQCQYLLCRRTCTSGTVCSRQNLRTANTSISPTHTHSTTNNQHIQLT